MNIVIVSGRARAAGGAEKVALSSAKRLAMRGHQVTVLAAYGPTDPDLLEVPNLRVLVANTGSPPEMPGFAERIQLVWPKGIAAFVKESLAGFQPEDSLIHFHNGYFEFSAPGFRALAHSGLPIVYTHHDYGWACPLTGFYDYSKNAHCSVEGGSFKCFATDCVNSHIEKGIRFSRHLGTHQTSGIGEAVKHHVFISHTACDKLKPYLGEKSNYSFLANATEFKQNPRRSIEAESNLIFVGRLTTEKDPLALAEGAAQAGMAVNYVGDGPLRDALTTRVGSEWVKGWQSPSETAEFISSSRALVLPSRWLEVAPLVLFEAAALGIPSVVPSDTAAAEFIDHENTGQIYDRSDASSLSSCLNRFKDVDYANRLGAAAYRRFWADPPTWTKHLDGLEAIYDRVLSVAPKD